MDELLNKLNFNVEGKQIGKKYIVELPVYDQFSTLYTTLDSMVDAERDSEKSSLTLEDGADIVYYIDGYKITMKGDLDKSEYTVTFEEE